MAVFVVTLPPRITEQMMWSFSSLHLLVDAGPGRVALHLFKLAHVDLWLSSSADTVGFYTNFSNHLQEVMNHMHLSLQAHLNS